MDHDNRMTACTEKPLYCLQHVLRNHCTVYSMYWETIVLFAAYTEKPLYCLQHVLRNHCTVYSMYWETIVLFIACTEKPLYYLQHILRNHCTVYSILSMDHQNGITALLWWNLASVTTSCPLVCQNGITPWTDNLSFCPQHPVCGPSE